MTPERLRALLHYEPTTGEFTWLVNRSQARIGNHPHCVNKAGYLVIGLDGKIWYAHRLAWLYVHGIYPAYVDHINHDKQDNRLANLRSVSVSENGWNRKGAQANNKLGARGVSKSRGKYRVVLGTKHLGYFDSIGAATLAHKTALREKL